MKTTISHTNQWSQNKWIHAIWVLLFGIALTSLWRSTFGQATDFEVFWRVGQSLKTGEPFYSVATQPGMVFKYPPWVAALFLPFGWVDFISAKAIWATVEVGSLLAVLRWIALKFDIPTRRILSLFFIFWGVWVVHFLDGQMVLPMLAVYLWSSDGGVQKTDLSPPRSSSRFLEWGWLLMSTKVFSAFPIVIDLFSPGSIAQKFKFWLKLGILLGLLTLAACYLSYQGEATAMFQAWQDSATSGARDLGLGHTRGPKNQGLVSWLANLMNWPLSATLWEVGLSFFLFLVVGGGALICGKMNQMPVRRLRLVLLALTPVLHPLPWHHLYVFSFPLLVVTSKEVLNQGRILQVLFWISTFLLSLSSKRAIPFGEVGWLLESNAGRAWGALLLCVVSLICGRLEKNESTIKIGA